MLEKYATPILKNKGNDSRNNNNEISKSNSGIKLKPLTKDEFIEVLNNCKNKLVH